MIRPVLISSRPRILIRFNGSIAFDEQEALGLCCSTILSSVSWLALQYTAVWSFAFLCSFLCRKESLENKKNNKPEVNQIANSDNKVFFSKITSMFQSDSVPLTP